LPFEPLEWYDVIFTRIKNPPIRRIYVYRPVEVWDEEFHSSDGILKTNFGLKYEIKSLTHKLGVVVDLDVKQNVSRFFTRVPWLFTKTVTRHDVPLLHSSRNLEF
jgi:hypothetical protein